MLIDPENKIEQRMIQAITADMVDHYINTGEIVPQNDLEGIIRSFLNTGAREATAHAEQILADLTVLCVMDTY